MREPIGRRTTLRGLGAIAAATATRAVAADAWPNRPVKLILPFAPGGGADFIARQWVEKLHQAFGQPFVIDYRGGAGGAIGTEAAVRATPDGYNFWVGPNGTLTVLPQVRTVSYDPVKDLVPVARLGDLVCGFVIPPAKGLETIGDVVEYARKNPRKLTFGSAGVGTSSHMRIEIFKYRAGIDILHVPYRSSSDAMNDLLGGHIDMMNEIVVLPHVKAGKLKLLNINHVNRHPDFPAVPTLTEAGYPHADAPIWISLQAPVGTPRDIIETLNAKIREIARTDDMIQRLRGINVVVPIQTTDEMVAFRAADIAANGQVIREANIRVE